MKEVITERCCGNCEWSISPEMEQEIFEENHYDDSDLNRPRAGDCCLNINHKGNYVCKEHDYVQNGINTYALYDEEYLGPGLFIITEYYNEIIKFIKIFKTDKTYPNYNIRGYEVDYIKENYANFRELKIEISTEQVELYNIINNFAKRLENDKIYSINSLHGKNSLYTKTCEYSTSLILSKDIYKIREESDFIDIELGDYLTCDKYEEIARLFNTLYKKSINVDNDATVKKILRMTKNRGI